MDRELLLLLEEFREKRLLMIKTDKAPIPLLNGKFIIHLIPEQVLNEPVIEFDLSKLANDVRAVPLFGKEFGSGPLTYNFEGILCKSIANSGRVLSYVQFFRNGVIEAVENFYLNREDKEIPIYDYEQELIIKTDHYLEQQATLGVQAPVYFLLSILGADKYQLLGSPFQREEMLFPPRVFAGDEHNSIKLLRPAIDQLWQAGGKRQSLSFDKGGQFNPR